jgi:Tn3 transposase DDE domain
LIVFWQTVYTQAALDHLAASGYPLDPADVARLTPLPADTRLVPDVTQYDQLLTRNLEQQ